MRRPLLRLLDCSSRQLLRHPTLWLLCGLYLVMVLAVVFPLTIYSGSRTGFESLRLLNVLTAVFVPAFGASRMVDDVASGTLMLMKVAGLSAGKWIAFRLLSIAALYLAVWSVRIPIYSLVLSTGIAPLAEVLWGEALTWCLMIAASPLSLLAARTAENRQSAVAASVGSVFVLNAAYFLPSFLVLVVQNVGGSAVPAFAQRLSELSRDLSPLKHVFGRPTTPESQFTAPFGLAIPVVLGVIASVWLSRLLYVQTDAGGVWVSGLLGKREHATSRPSRRVWDDAFAWQAAEFHCRTMPKTRIVAWIAIAVTVYVAFQWRMGAGTSTMLGVLVIAILCSPGAMPSMCVAQELRQNTLVSLAILPAGGTAIYRGWLRGNRRQRAQAWLGAAIIFAISLWAEPFKAVVWAAAGIAAMSAFPPVSFVESLASHEASWKSVVRSILAGCTSLLIRPVGALPVVAVAAAAGVLYRPRAIRLIDQRFEAASAR